MTTRRLTPVVAPIAVALLALVACGDDAPRDTSGPSTDSAGQPSDTGCAAAVDSIVSATERYVASYEAGRTLSAATATEADGAGTTTTAGDGSPEAITEGELRAVLTDAEAAIRAQRCDPTRVRVQLTEGLSRVSVEGPVADAVLRQLTASLTGKTAAAPTVATVGVGEDIRDALAELPDGSTLELEAGEYRLDGSLVLLAGIVIRGAGRDATTIVSTAPDAAVLALTDRRIELVGLTVRHEGDAPASGVLGGPAASVVVTDARLTGGKTDPDGFGGAGILMYADGQEAAGRGTTLEVTGTELRDNEAAGIVLSGGHRSSIIGAVFASNGRCGICYLGTADGSVEDSTFEGNEIGIAVTGTAEPTLLRLTIDGGEVGIQAGDAAAPTVETVTVSGSARAAIIFTGTASGNLNEVTCERVPFGIVLDPEAMPQIGTTNCELARPG